MAITMSQLCAMLEVAAPTARATPATNQAQVIVTFTNRPDVEIALLTPWQQRELRTGTLDADTITELIFTIRKLANV